MYVHCTSIFVRICLETIHYYFENKVTTKYICYLTKVRSVLVSYFIRKRLNVDGSFDVKKTTRQTSSVTLSHMVFDVSTLHITLSVFLHTQRLNFMKYKI